MNDNVYTISYPAVHVGSQKTDILFYTDIADITVDSLGVSCCENIMVTDDCIASFYDSLPYMRDALVLPSGEAYKTLDSISSILRAAAKAGVARDGLFCGFGGGVVCDMTAFASSVYMRGAQVILIPTTLLAMVDAAVGGKTACDFFDIKNMIGTFYPARSIHICPSFLKTLSAAEYRSGLGEVLKTALLYAPQLYTILCSEKASIDARNPVLLMQIIKCCVQAKSQLVQNDFMEKDVRMQLNFGHTFAHALESLAGFGSITHGDAVAWGIGRALELGVMLGITDTTYRDEVFCTLEQYGWETAAFHPILKNRFDSPVEASRLLLEKIKSDKKKKGGAVHFILQHELNSTLIVPVVDEAVLAVLQ